MKWQEADAAVFIYDRYGVWKVDPGERGSPILMLGDRKNKNQYRYIQVEPEERFIKPGHKLIFRSFSENTKQSGLWQNEYVNNLNVFSDLKPISIDSNISIGQVIRSKNSDAYIYTKETYKRSPDLYIGYAIRPADSNANKVIKYSLTGKRLSFLNPQQKDYNWGTAELFKWKAYNGKESTGIVYKPEDFDPKKKYPMICYFYETLSDVSEKRLCR